MKSFTWRPIIHAVGVFIAVFGAEICPAQAMTVKDLSCSLHLSKEDSPSVVLKTTPLLKVFRGESTGESEYYGPSVRLRYFTDAERARFKVKVEDGLLKDNKGGLFSTLSSSTIFGGKGFSIFIVDKHGDIYILNNVGNYIQHSSAARGEDVAMAGEIRVVSGRIELFNRKSGHYRPAEALSQQFLFMLRHYGVPDVDQIKVDAGF